MDGEEFAQVPMGLPGVTAAARVLVGAGYEWDVLDVRELVGHCGNLRSRDS